MNVTRILVVDDDKSVLRMIEYGLQRLGSDYQIYTAKDMDGALNLIENQHIDLVITDYMMPGLTGIDLARAVHHLSPSTQIVLMTAYGTEKLRDTSNHVGFDGYIDKPFDIEKIREIIRAAKNAKNTKNTKRGKPVAVETAQSADSAVAVVETTEPVETAESAPPDASPPGPRSITELLQALQVNAGARAVLLINALGDLVKITGQIDQARAASVASLAASTFLHTAELSSLLGNKRVFKSGFYEGDAYNIYICDVNQNALLAVVFDIKLRSGVVWFYTKQAAAELAPLLT